MPALPAGTPKALLNLFARARQLLPASLRLRGAASVYCTGGSLALVVQPLADELRWCRYLSPVSLQTPVEQETGLERRGNNLLKAEPYWKMVVRFEARFSPSVEPNAERNRGARVRGGAEVGCAGSFTGCSRCYWGYWRVGRWQQQL
jgi:hypothetical protein